MSAVAIKEAIKTNLQALKDAGTIAGFKSSDLKKDILDAATPGSPYAYLMPPSIESEVLTNREIVRTYSYDIMILWNAEKIIDDTTVEEDIEALLNHFDNNPTLDGTAMAGLLPVSSAPQPMQHAGRDFIMAILQLQAKQHVTLTF